HTSVVVAALRSICFYFFFFFSSRRRHTRLQGDWSSDVCSSDLTLRLLAEEPADGTGHGGPAAQVLLPVQRAELVRPRQRVEQVRSEERRVGKECRSRRARYH